MRQDYRPDQTTTPPRRDPWWKGLIRPLVLLLVAGVFVRIYGCAERLYFYPDRSAFQTPAGYEDLVFSNAEGHDLHGWFMPPAGDVPQPWPVVLHVHGNAGNLTHHASFCEWLTDHGFAVMLFDYRGYGRSQQGQLTRDTVLADAHAALDALIADPRIDQDRIAVFGFSLGGATATRLVSERKEPVALVAAAPFSGWQRVAKDYVSVLAKGLIAKGGDPKDAIRNIGERPVLLLHGLNDSIVRPYHTELLLAAAHQAGVPATREVFEGLDHNTLLLDEAVRIRIAEFLDESVAAGQQ